MWGTNHGERLTTRARGRSSLGGPLYAFGAGIVALLEVLRGLHVAAASHGHAANVL